VMFYITGGRQGESACEVLHHKRFPCISSGFWFISACGVCTYVNRLESRCRGTLSTFYRCLTAPPRLPLASCRRPCPERRDVGRAAAAVHERRGPERRAIHGLAPRAPSADSRPRAAAAGPERHAVRPRAAAVPERRAVQELPPSPSVAPCTSCCPRAERRASTS
jgi:hypothetical protein